jgi:hypothetical protein
MRIKVRTITAIDDDTFQLTFSGAGDEVVVIARMDGLSVKTTPDILMYGGADARAIIQAVKAFHAASHEQLDWPQTSGR